MITLPTKTIETIDQMDIGMDLLRTAYAALQDRSIIDDRMLSSIASSLCTAIETLEPVRAAVNEAHI